MKVYLIENYKQLKRTITVLFGVCLLSQRVEEYQNRSLLLNALHLHKLHNKALTGDSELSVCFA